MNVFQLSQRQCYELINYFNFAVEVKNICELGAGLFLTASVGVCV